MFHAAVRVALDESRKKTTTVPRAAWNPRWAQPTGQEKSLRALAILTRDLDTTLPTMKKLAPRLWHLLSKVDSDARKRVSTTRRNWCKSLGGRPSFPRLSLSGGKMLFVSCPILGPQPRSTRNPPTGWPRSTKSTPQQPASCARAGRPSTTSNATSGATSQSGTFRFRPVSGEAAPQRREDWIRRGSVATHFGNPLGDLLADLLSYRSMSHLR